MSRDKIKIHNVMHDPVEFAASDVERKMERIPVDDRIADVHVAKGYRNSPVFITLDESVSVISVHSMKKISRKVLREFDRQVSGIDIDDCLRDKNIRLEKKSAN